MVKYIFLVCTLCGTATLLAQRDSTLLLAPERLQEKDIVTRNLDQRRTMAISATRSLEDIERLPWSVWVITADDILRYGFVTLGDVLKAAPGIRVSPSGNALEGETFLMRGLSGNQYVKILINDVPVKPSAAAGISIGAQLPIRQAQRIEVLYGPASAIYGEEACVGVINIILKESERPIFTQADISFGNDGYNSLDVMCGGKLGRDKKIFRFSAYGSSTVRERTDLYYDQNLFNLSNYLPLGFDASLYRQNPNFIPSDADSLPKTVAAVHESRLFGINLTFRGLHFTYHRMGRTDYSPLGLNPLAVSWSNSANQLLERTETFALGFQRIRRLWVTNTNISFLKYRIGNTSTTNYIFDRLSAANFQFDLQQAPGIPDSAVLLQRAFAKLAQGSRYTVASGFDARLESRLNARLGSRFHLDAGLQVNFGGGVAPSSHLVNPVDITVLGKVKPNGGKPFQPYFAGELEVTAFGQLEWRMRQWSVLAGTSANFSDQYKRSFPAAPRAAVFYRVDSVWSVFTNYAMGFRRPSLYQIGQSYVLTVENSATGESSISPGRNAPQRAETFRSFEAGVRYHRRRIRSQLTFFREQGDQLIRPGFLQKETPAGDGSWSYGYRNTPGQALSMWGWQAQFVTENYMLQNVERLSRYRLRARTEIFFQYARGREWYGDLRMPTSDVFNAPRRQTQARFVVAASKLELMLSYNRQTTTLSKSILYRNQRQRGTLEHYPTFNTWDTRAQIYLSNHFLVYLQLQNMFNRHYAGLDATGTSDDLLYNPQPGRLVRFGLNYNMN